MEIKVEMITPLMAARWLETQTSNRPLSARQVGRYADAIRRGEWALNGEAIKFDKDGRLIDGQHRLAASVKADRAFQSAVVYGLNGGAFETFDTGKNRSIGDILSLAGFQDVAVLGGVARLAYSHYTFGTPNPNSSQRHFITNGQLLHFVQDKARSEQLVEAARKAHTVAVHKSLFSVTIAGYMWYATHVANAAIADDFFVSLATNIRDDDPASLLANRIAVSRLSSKHTSREEALAVCIKAWNAFAQNDTMKMLVYRMVGSKREEFPEFFGLNTANL